MGQRFSVVMVALGVVGLLSQSCDSGSSDAAGGAGDAGAGDASAGGAHSGTAGGANDAGTSPTSAGAAGEGGMGGSGPSADSAGAGGMSSAEAGAAGMNVGVAETACVKTADCLPICQKYGWPTANCFGAIKQYCLCKTNDAEPSCKIGTTEGCPPRTKCYGGHACMPYGAAVDGDPCDNGDECAVGFVCVKGGPGSEVQYTHCRAMCDSAQPKPAGCYSCNGVYCDPAP